ncbi:MAG: hypothetical protein IT385_09400 [Deltaproteobacteria bacterium]|nr:hypothetical protein [Deltaproteobacteria bacterium]
MVPLVTALALSVSNPGPAWAGEPDYNAPWRQGRSRLGLGGGLIGLSGSDDFYFGLSYGYFIVDNLELGVDTLLTFGSQPFTARVGPSLLYVIPVEAQVQPYVGGFYRHWFISDDALADLDSLGWRAGLVLRTGGTFLQLGIVMESVLDCEGDDCTSFYPELALSLSL